jgi:hypothetical protein
VAKAVSIHATPAALEVLGASTAQLNQAIACWAELITQSSADNAKAFSREEWCLLAEALNGVKCDPSEAAPGNAMASALEEAERNEGFGTKWLGEGRDPELEALLERMRTLDYAHAWAVILAVQWYWAHYEAVRLSEEPWWTLQYRLLFEGVSSSPDPNP